MNKEKLKEEVGQAIEQEKARIVGWAKEIPSQSELSFKERDDPHFFCILLI